MQAARGGVETCREGWKEALQGVGKDRRKERRGMPQGATTIAEAEDLARLAQPAQIS